MCKVDMYTKAVETLHRELIEALGAENHVGAKERVMALLAAAEERDDMAALLGECYWAISRGDLRERIDKFFGRD